MHCRRKLIQQNAPNMILSDENLVIGMNQHCLHIGCQALSFTKLLRLYILSAALQLCEISLRLVGSLLCLLAFEQAMFELATLTIQPAARRRHNVWQNDTKKDDQENAKPDIKKGKFGKR